VKEKRTKSHHTEATAHHRWTHDHKRISPDNRIATVVHHHIPAVVHVDVHIIIAYPVIVSPITTVDIIAAAVIANVRIVAAPVIANIVIVAAPVVADV
jgi:hypothetical protein